MSYSPPPFDPDAQALLQAMRGLALPAFETLTPPEARQLLADLRRRVTPPDIPMSEVVDSSLAGVPVRLYRPTEGTLPIAVFLHGGGWVVGGLESHDTFCRTLARDSGAAVLAVDYRLAPEHPFPAGLEDALAVIRALPEFADRQGLDAARLAYVGDSAGGNLAAVAALMTRDGALAVLRLQVLLCPVVDCRLMQPSHQLLIEGLPVNGPTMRWFRDHYLAGGNPADWRASPLLAEMLTGVAPVVLVTAGIDPLCDEGLAYAARLAEAQVPLVHHHLPGQSHGFLTAGLALPRSQALVRLLGTYLTQALADCLQAPLKTGARLSSSAATASV